MSLFVYGSLRVGESLERCLPPNLPRTIARVRGRLHYAHGCRGIPVMLRPLTADDWTYGEVIDVDLFNEQVQETTAMELAAGYNAEWTTAVDDSGDVHDVVAFVYVGEQYGDPIEGGDYTRRVEGPNLGRCEFDAVEDQWCHTHQTFSCAFADA